MIGSTGTLAMQEGTAAAFSVGGHNTKIQVFMLGHPRVEMDGTAVRIPRTQVQALLYRLAIRPVPVDRDYLCTLFWPETTDRVARTNLRRLISLLRKALPRDDLLTCCDNGVMIDPETIWADTHTFEQLSTAARRLADLPTVERALSHYGGPFLSAFTPPGYEFDAWCSREREAFQGLYLSNLLWLMDHYVDAQELPKAIICAKQYLATDLLEENVHRQLIELYLASGDRTAALRQCELCKAVLERELGVPPLPETMALCDAARRASFAIPLPSPIGPAATAPPNERWNLPLLGRDRELDQLRVAFKNAQAGLPAVVLISGEPGVGKTRLMRSFCSSVAYRARVLAAEACQHTAGLPYFPIVQALRPALSEVRLDKLVDPVWLSEAARLLPELLTNSPNVTRTLPGLDDETRVRLFEALVRVLRGLIQTHGPVLLAIDDMHHADEATLEWLAYLCHGLQTEKLMVIGCYRPAPGHASNGFERFCAGLARQRGMFQLNLGGLDESAVKAIISRIGALLSTAHGSATPDQLAQQLRRVSDGNPLFVLEILDHIAQGGGALPDLLDESAVPTTARLHSMIGDQLMQLSPINRQTLEAAAVLGPRFSLDLLRQTSRRSEDETLASVDQLSDLRLLIAGDDGYRFHHELVRQTVAGETGPARHEMLHRRAARALKRLPGANSASLAYHYDSGRQWTEALTYYGLAARQAENVSAWRDAVKHIDRMLVIIDGLDPDLVASNYLEQRVELLAKRAQLEYILGEISRRDQTLATLEAVARSSGQEALKLQAALEQISFLNTDGQYQAAAHLAERHLRESCPAEDVRSRIQLLAQLGHAKVWLGEPRQAAGLLTEALALLGDQPAPEVAGPIYRSLGYAALHTGDYRQTRDWHQKARACHQAPCAKTQQVQDLFDMAFLWLRLNHLSQSTVALDEALGLAHQINARPAEALGETLLGYQALYRGCYWRAHQRFRRALPMRESMCATYDVIETGLGLALSSFHLGRYAEASEVLENAADRCAGLGHCRQHIKVTTARGLIAMDQGELGRAESLLAEAVAAAARCECLENLARATAARARAMRLLGDLEGALSQAREALRIATLFDLASVGLWAQVELGATLLRQGRGAEALTHSEDAVHLVTRAHQAWFGAEHAYQCHAQVLSAMGETEAAAAAGDRAQATIADKASRIEYSRARQQYLERASASLALTT